MSPRVEFTSAHAKEVHDAGRAAFAALLAPPAKTKTRAAPSTSGTSTDPPAPTPSPLPSDIFAQLMRDSLWR